MTIRDRTCVPWSFVDRLVHAWARWQRASAARPRPAPSRRPIPHRRPPRTVARGDVAPREDEAIEKRVADLLAKMTVEEKVGQVIQGDISTVTPDDVRQYHLGSVLNGGGSGPHGDDFAPARVWLELADAYYEASDRQERRPHRHPGHLGQRRRPWQREHHRRDGVPA